jgi:hypothetical protein
MQEAAHEATHDESKAERELKAQPSKRKIVQERKRMLSRD